MNVGHGPRNDFIVGWPRASYYPKYISTPIQKWPHGGIRGDKGQWGACPPPTSSAYDVGLWTRNVDGKLLLNEVLAGTKKKRRLKSGSKVIEFKVKSVICKSAVRIIFAGAAVPRCKSLI